MFRYIIVRIIWMFFVLFLIISLLFIVTKLAMCELWSLPHPLQDDVPMVIAEYIKYIKGIFTNWDWGYSVDGEPVWDLLLQKIPISLKINLIAFIIYIPFGIIIGIISAVKRNTKTDFIIGCLTLIFSSIPSFILIFILIYVFGYCLHWLPPIYPSKISGFMNRLGGLIIPIIALSVGPVADLTRLVRGELIETLDSEYILLVRAKGLNKRQAIFRHALRNSLVPILPKIPSTFVYVLCGSFFIEIIYNIPGIANLFLDSLFRPFLFNSKYLFIDIYVVVIIGAFYSVLSLISALLVDISYGIIDPRIKMGSKK